MKTGSVIFLALLFFILTQGCGNESPTSAPGPTVKWAPLWLPGNDFAALQYVDGALYALDRTQGVYVQKPAFASRWVHLGPEFSDQLHSSPRMGMTSLAVLGDGLVVGVELPLQDTRPRLYTRRARDSGWRPGPDEVGSAVTDLIATESGTIVGLIDGWPICSEDDGRTWIRSLPAPLDIQRARLTENGGVLYCGGQAPTRQPRLYRSQTGGQSWEPVLLVQKLGIVEGIVYWAAGNHEPSTLFLTVNADVFRSRDDGTSFEHFLEIPRTPGQVLANPLRPGEMIVSGGYVHLTKDGGQTWDVFLLPPALSIKHIAVDWDRRRAAVVFKDNVREAVWSFDFSHLN